jgi:hypothetical protein
VSLDPTWRDGVYNALGPAEPGYLRTDPTGDTGGATRAPGRTLISAAVAAAKLLETGELEARLAVLEVAVGSARDTQADPADGGLLGG